MEYSQLFAQRIRQLCVKHGITINKLATMSGLKQSTVDNIIRAITFNMTLSEFLDFPELNNFLLEEDDIE